MKKARRYHVVLTRNDRGGFTVTVPGLAAVVTQGETRGEALANAADAVRVYIESLQARGLPIPEDVDISIEEVTVPM
jgi:predicted RNase H-like HicB family nuclease